MAKEFFGDKAQRIEPGKHLVVIQSIIDLGHQYTKDGTKTYHKLMIDLFYVEQGTRQSLSYFGTPTWLSKSKPGNVGLYELITAVEGRDLTADEFATYNVFSLPGKTITIVNEYDQNGQYINPVAAEYSATQWPTDGIDLTAYNYQEAIQPHVLLTLSKRTVDMLKSSKEWKDEHAIAPVEDPFAPVAPVAPVEESPTINLDTPVEPVRADDVPF